MFVYLFEAKSIQSYLFQSGKLKDVIAASERLDKLIDSNESSVLATVLQMAQLNSDLLEEKSDDNAICFLRCKGGTFYASCKNKAPLLQLRSLWTLTVSQLFPSLVHIDALTSGDDLQNAMQNGQEILAKSRNTPCVSLPIASAITQRYQRTGLAAVPLSLLSKWEADDVANQSKRQCLDADTEMHRQAYKKLNMRDGKDNDALQGRFTPDNLTVQISYPINFEKEFEFASLDELNRANKEAVKDIALVHIDGNGLGKLLIGLKTALKGKSDESYRKAFSAFSNAINKATIAAARKATLVVYNSVVKEYKLANKNINEKLVLPMRPIVLGGDDVTLFCRADLALPFAKAFCKAFKLESQQEIKPIFDKFLSKESNGLKNYITASGGILYAKVGHPFTQSNHLVEALCKQAKKLTKSIYGGDSNTVGPAALAVYRVSNASREKLEDLTLNRQWVEISQERKVSLAQQAYFVEQEVCDDENKTTTNNRSFAALEKLILLSNDKNPPVSMAKWRQISTLLAQGDDVEAARLYYRSLNICRDENLKSKFNAILAELIPTHANKDQQLPWCWLVDNKLQSVIDDLLIIDHFQLSQSAQQDSK